MFAYCFIPLSAINFTSSDTFRSNSGPCPSLTVFEPIGLGSLKCRIRCKQDWRVLFVWFFFCNVSCKCPPHSVASYAVSKRCGEAVVTISSIGNQCLFLNAYREECIIFLYDDILRQIFFKVYFLALPCYH